MVCIEEEHELDVSAGFTFYLFAYFFIPRTSLLCG